MKQLNKSKLKDFAHAQALPLPAMLFDLDGTLIDSAYEHVLAWHETFNDFRMEIPNWKIHRRIGMSGAFFLPKLLREIDRSANKAMIDRLEKRHAKYFGKEGQNHPSASRRLPTAAASVQN